MFRGTFEHGIDAKGRTSLPARFREVLAGRQEDFVVVTHGPDRSLMVYPPAAWAEIEERVRRQPQFDQGVREMMHAFVAPAQDCKLDGMGRILVPETLRKYAGLGTEVVWVGAIARMELWDAARWKAKEEQSRQLLDDAGFAERLAKLGI